MVDKYTYFNDLQLEDFLYIIGKLKDKNFLIYNGKYEDMAEELCNILEDYVEE